MAEATLETALPAFRAYLSTHVGGEAAWVEAHVAVVQHAEAARGGDGLRLLHACTAMYTTRTEYVNRIGRVLGSTEWSTAWVSSPHGRDVLGDMFAALATQHAEALKAFQHLSVLDRGCAKLWREYLVSVDVPLDHRAICGLDAAMKIYMGEAAWAEERAAILRTRLRVDPPLGAVPPACLTALADVVAHARGRLLGVDTMFRVYEAEEEQTEVAWYVALVRVEAAAPAAVTTTAAAGEWIDVWPQALTGPTTSVELLDDDGAHVPFEVTFRDREVAAPCPNGILRAADDCLEAVRHTRMGFLTLIMRGLRWRPLASAPFPQPRVARFVGVKLCTVRVIGDRDVAVVWITDPHT